MPFENEVNLLAFKQGKTKTSDYNVRSKQLASAIDVNEIVIFEAGGNRFHFGVFYDNEILNDNIIGKLA